VERERKRRGEKNKRKNFSPLVWEIKINGTRTQTDGEAI
jgi:hypothetical protein